MDNRKTRQLNWFLSLHAVLLIGFGIAFALYGPLMMALFTVPELEINEPAYWGMTSFARMFGAALFGFGLLVFSLRTALPESSPETRRGVLFALFLANLMGAFVSVTQQSSVWGTPAGWITSGVFIMLLIVYGYFLATARSE